MESMYIGYCLGLNHTKYVMKSRPWNCEVHFDIFQRLYTTIPNIYKRDYKRKIILSVSAAQIDLWYFPRNISNLKEGLRKWTPTPMSLIKVNIIMDREYKRWLNNIARFHWIHKSVGPSERGRNDRRRVVSGMSSELYIAMLTERFNLTTECNITRVLALKSCYNCPLANNFITTTEISHSAWKLGLHPSKWLAIDSFFPTRGEMVAYYVTDGTDVPNFAQCRNIETLDKVMYNNYTDPKFELALIHMVQLILKNVTYAPDSPGPQCVNGKITDVLHLSKILVNFKVEYHSERDEYAMIKLSDDDSIPTFLACGRSTPQGFAFDELVNVFNIEIWEFLLIFMALLTIITVVVDVIPVDITRSIQIRNSLSLEKLVSIFIQVTKALLEQGDPFASTIAVKFRLRFSIGTYLLVAIVLSNAYKSNNVYNLVLPRKPVA